MATTAVVAGTASAVAHSKEQKYAQQEAAAQQRAAEQEELAGLRAQQAAAAAPPPATPAPAPRPDRIQQLKDLAALKEAGVLTDEEFQAEKARILAS